LRVNLNVQGCGIVAPLPLALPICSPSFFTQSPYPPRSLVRDEQTHPHSPRLVVSHSTCPPLSSSPPANSFVIGPAVINTHTPSDGATFRLHDALLALLRAYLPPRAAKMWRDACDDFVFPQGFSQGWTALVRLFDLQCVIAELTVAEAHYVKRLDPPT
jgi:hypothetical protein